MVEEQVVFTKPCVWLISAKSLPSYRINFPIPLLLDFAVHVTNLRVLLEARILLTFRQQFSIWYKPHGDDDVLTNVAVSTGRFPYVQLDSEAPDRRVLRASQCRIRIYMRNPDILKCAIESIG